MKALHPDLRRKLERTVLEARVEAEKGARAALERLAVGASEPFQEMSAVERSLRNRLRAHGRQLGDTRDARSGAQSLDKLTAELAYEYWHRMLFARFLAENHLLMHPEGVAVTLEECEELAPEEGAPNGFVLAARYASRMLPQIFRQDDPVLGVAFAQEHQRALEKLLEELPADVFTADDSLGWVYQFWQADEKDRVNHAGDKIGADELPAVTQLFTEHYMVLFLLHNTVGAWWVARHGSKDLPTELDYLRALEDGAPAAGRFEGWPERVAELRVLDPCCGSGHFLVAVFNLLVRLRVREEGLSKGAATGAVLRDNLYGLELDPRCTQIAAFALALAAWKFIGDYRELPPLNIASSGVAPRGKRAEWVALANGDDRLRDGMERLYDLFKQAPELGSLIAPAADGAGTLLSADFVELQPLLEKALQTEAAREDVERTEAGVAAQGLARAAEMLAGQYHLVVTNVPYLARGKQAQVLRDFGERRYPEAKADLATVFVERCLELCEQGGTAALVTPQNWLYLGTYKKLRKRLLQKQTWNVIARLGSGAFETISGEVVNVALLGLTRGLPKDTNNLLGINTQMASSPTEKNKVLKTGTISVVGQKGQLNNPDATITGEKEETGTLLGEYVESYHGITTTDYPRFGRFFWENKGWDDRWVYQQGTVGSTQPYGGKESVLLWEDGKGGIRQLLNSGAPVVITGLEAWGKRGVVINQMSLQASIYTGEAFDTNVAILIPRRPEFLPAVWAFCSSPDFHATVRKLNPKVVVEYVYYPKLPFNLGHWQSVADKMGPLPEPYADDPTQWLFNGGVPHSTAPLQVAVARLLGYHWPDQPADYLDELTDNDGILCLPPVRGEQAASERLREFLARAYGSRWSPAVLAELLAAAGSPDKTLDEWLRQHFFEQHFKLFHQRPFIWHIWDGQRAGFSALVNYHKLDRQNLEKLTYTYLGDWIKRQKDDLDRGEGGADARLLAAQDLQDTLKLIIEGEPPYDIFVRWKPTGQQPVGWEPDLDDGVRLNIRPFVEADILRKRPNINWNKDRGKNPPGAPWGTERLNDLHLTLAEKLAARRGAGAKR
jgi:hypothetical protein